jgi:hypothetical protein
MRAFFPDWLKITDPNLFGPNFSASALESNSLAGYFRLKLVQSVHAPLNAAYSLETHGHQDWPVKSAIGKLAENGDLGATCDS